MHEKQKCKVTNVFASYSLIFYQLYLEANGISTLEVQPQYEEVDMIMEFEAPCGPDMWIVTGI